DHLQPADVRHHQIHQRDVNLLLAEDFQRGAAVVGGEHLHPAMEQHAREPAADHRLVVDHEHARGLPGKHGGRRLLERGNGRRLTRHDDAPRAAEPLSVGGTALSESDTGVYKYPSCWNTQIRLPPSRLACESAASAARSSASLVRTSREGYRATPIETGTRRADVAGGCRCGSVIS